MDPAQLVRMYAADVFALCRAMVRDTQLAEDLAQDTFARAFAALAGYRGEASPRTWLLAIARNRCLDHLDRARRAPWGRDPDPEPDDHVLDQPAPFDLLATRDDAERALHVLAETERALVVLHYGHGVGYPELAASFGLGQGAVRMRMSRAVAKMRAALAEELTSELSADEVTAERAAFASVERAAALGDELALDDELSSASGAMLAGEPEPLASRTGDLGDAVLGEPLVHIAALYEPPTPRLLARLDALARQRAT